MRGIARGRSRVNRDIPRGRPRLAPETDMGGFVNARWGFVALASGALALGLLAPATGSAAPQATKPSGQALVRIDGGDAQAIKRGHNLYRLVLPRGASIHWLGEANRKLSIGTLGRKGLVAGWTRLGHSATGTHALSTVTWSKPSKAAPPYVGAFVARPKLNSDGVLTFLARTSGPLPARLPNFSLNVARPVANASRPRATGYPLAFPVNTSSSTVGVQATATGDNAATIVFGNVSGGVITSACAKPPTQSMTGTDPNDYVTFAGTCGDTTWSGGTLSFFPMQGNGSTIPAQLQMQATVLVKGGNPSTFPWNFNMGQWKAGGVQVWPK